MIDTLLLNIPEYAVKSGHCLSVARGIDNHETGETTGANLLWCVDGAEQRGAFGLYDAPHFNLRLRPLSFAQDVVQCTVQFSAPKLASGDNYAPANAATLKTALKHLQTGLDDVGIACNVYSATVSRLDATRNVISDEPFSSYYEVLSKLRCKFKHKYKDYGNSFLLHNTQQQINIYDKLAEMAHNKLDVSTLPNTVRFEQRWIKPQKVKNVLGMSLISDITKNLDIVEEQYRLSMENKLFSLSTPDFDVLTSHQIAEELKFFIDRGDKNWFDAWFNIQIYRSLPSIKSIIDALEGIAVNSGTKSKIKNKLHRVQMDAFAFEPAIKGRKTSSQLYEELKRKVLA